MNNHLVQSTSGARPLWVDDFGDGKAAVQFASSRTDRLLTTRTVNQDWTPDVSSALYWYVVANWTNNAKSPNLMLNIQETGQSDQCESLTTSGGPPPTGFVHVYKNASNTTTNLTSTTSFPANGVWFLLEGIRDGANVSIILNGTQIATVASARTNLLRSGVTLDTTIFVGNRPAAGVGLDGNLREVVICNAIPTSQQLTDIRARVASVYGITVA